MPKVWKLLPQKSQDLIEQLLINRGLTKKEEIDQFFNPKLENFQKDIDIPGIPKALKRIDEAIERGELIVIFGDYDVDGISASAILYKAFTAMGAKALPYIPHREKEGYGLNKIGLEFARDAGASLVITVDNGIVAIEQAKFAKEIGLELIITDHHMPLDEKPEALAIVHSTKMCGAGVAWCLIQSRVSEKLRKELMQFAAIATITDLIPLQGVARAFVAEGIKVLNKTDNLGFLSLFRECGIVAENIGTYEIGHIIGPRMNAIGRLEHAIDALRLLCTKDPAKARKLAQLLCETNTQRQQITITAVEQAKLMVEKDSKIHILYSENWVPGIIGLVAGRICEEYGRPAIAISIGPDGFAKGSARSANGTNIIEVIRTCSDILVDVGGHKGAAGFSIATENIKTFKIRMEEALKDLPDDVSPEIEIEMEVPVQKLSKSLVKDLEKLAPYGFGNPQPIFATNRMQVSDVRTLSEGKHLKFRAEGMDCIAFGFGPMSDLIKNGMLIDLAYYLEINKFNGNEILQLKVKDIRFSGTS
jgi:single-stranded-DNA-specific exonuclease